MPVCLPLLPRVAAEIERKAATAAPCLRVALHYGPGDRCDETLTLLRALAISAASVLALTPSTVFAAHAGDPYRNVDHSNDMGNDTGDLRVEGLNDQQRNENYRGPLQLRAPATNPRRHRPRPPTRRGSPLIATFPSASGKPRGNTKRRKI